MDAWLTLLRTPSIGPATLRTAVARHGSASTALEALRRGDSPRELDAEARRWLDAPDPARMEADLEWLEHPDHHLLGWDDPDYPSLLREIPGAPAALFVDGDPTLLWMPQVAIVGSRSASEHGLALCRRFARALASAGFTVTSGMADGIDGAAHQAALDADARTVAVLGTGPDLVYPRKHRALAARIAASGALVSEFPPGTAAKPEHFPRRNRIISGLALGTLVVEAGLRSGSLITARCASEQGREVFAIPGSINNPLARGCHQLIRDGARLTESAEEIIAELSALAASLGDRLRARLGSAPGSAADTGAAVESTPTGSRDPDYVRLLEALGHDESSLDELAARTGLAVSALSSMLLVLELEGDVRPGRGGKYTRIPRS
ncbi:MAG: DNA-processing protein DprA [Dokdonella sp.]|nr:DNA-processing protein DprA [Dokdonella sp.]MCB1572218.1 DNA-processing protein DprA [Xanthomonadales bacterium]MCB1574222.1 DNA-processing protein DprA [Xanthomonadales bacterium]